MVFKKQASENFLLRFRHNGDRNGNQICETFPPCFSFNSEFAKFNFLSPLFTTRNQSPLAMMNKNVKLRWQLLTRPFKCKLFHALDFNKGCNSLMRIVRVFFNWVKKLLSGKRTFYHFGFLFTCVTIYHAHFKTDASF